MNPKDAGPAQGPHGLLNESYTASNQAYERYDNHPLPKGWQDVTPSGKSENAQLFAKAEACELVSPSGQHFVTFRGTSTAYDGVEDLRQGAGLDTAKYDAAAKIGEAYRGKNVVFTGHSLGGGEAQLAAAVASERPSGDPLPRPAVCVTFNSAYPDHDTLKAKGVNPNDVKSHLVEVVNEHDPLNRGVYGGKTTAFGGEIIKDREGKNDVVIIAEGAGGYKGQGHRLGSMAGPDGELTSKLYDDKNMHVNKADFDRLLPGRAALGNTQSVVQTLEAAQGQDLQVSRGGHGGR